MTNPDITKLAAAHAASTPEAIAQIIRIVTHAATEKEREAAQLAAEQIALLYQHVPALLAELERLREALEKMQRSRDRYREAWAAEKAHGTERVAAALGGHDGGQP